MDACMDYKSVAPEAGSMLRIRIGKSTLLATILVLVHAIAAASVAICLPPGMASLGVAAIAASGIHWLRTDALRVSADAIVEFQLRQGGSCTLLTRGGRMLSGQVQGSTYVSPGLIVVNIRLDPGRRRLSVVLPRDSSAPETLRELRVWLRYRCAGTPPESAAL